jgi:hypothetical protein
MMHWLCESQKMAVDAWEKKDEGEDEKDLS